MIKTYTGKEVKYYWGWRILTSNVQFGCVETQDGFVEFYATDDPKLAFSSSLETLTSPIYTIKVSSCSSYEQQAHIIKDALKLNNFSSKIRSALREHYNDWYKYEPFFEKIA